MLNWGEGGVENSSFVEFVICFWNFSLFLLIFSETLKIAKKKKISSSKVRKVIEVVPGRDKCTSLPTFEDSGITKKKKFRRLPTLDFYYPDGPDIIYGTSLNFLHALKHVRLLAFSLKSSHRWPSVDFQPEHFFVTTFLEYRFSDYSFSILIKVGHVHFFISLLN